MGGEAPAPAETGSNLIDADLTIKQTTLTELAKGGVGVLGQGGWGVGRIEG